MVPVNEGPFGVHQVEFVIQTTPGFSNGRCIGQHANSTLRGTQIATWNDCWRLVINSHLERQESVNHFQLIRVDVVP